MTKKLLCLALSLALAFTLAVTAFAEDTLNLLSVRVLEDGYLSVIAGTDYTAEADMNITASTENGPLEISDTVVMRNEGTSWFVVLEYGYYGDSEPLIRTQKRVTQKIADMIDEKDEGALVYTQTGPSIALERASLFKDALTRKHEKKKDGAKELASTVRAVADYIGENKDRLKSNVVMIIVTACPSGQVTESMVDDIGKTLSSYSSVSTHIIVTAGGDVHTKDRPLGQKLMDKAKLTVGGTAYMTDKLTQDEGERAVQRIVDAERRKIMMVLDPQAKKNLGHTLTITQTTSGGKKMTAELKLVDDLYSLWEEKISVRVPDVTPPPAGVVMHAVDPVMSWVSDEEYMPQSKAKGISTELLVGIIIGVVILALVAILLIMRLKKNKKPAKSASQIYASGNSSSGSGSSGTSITLAGDNGAVLKGQLKSGRLTIGRSGAKAMLAVPNDGKLSGLHATFTKQGSSLTVTDNGSTNGTKVNGNKIAPGVPTVIRQNDTVTLGSTTYTVTWRG